MQPKVLLIFALTCGAVTAERSFENAPSFPLPTLKYGDLAAMDESSSAQLLHTLSTLGIVAIEEVPGYSEARVSALSDLGEKCLSSTEGGASVQTSVLMADGTNRRTAGTSTKFGRAGRMVQDKSQAACDASTATLRGLVDLTARTLFHALDSVVFENSEKKDTHLMSSLKENVKFETFDQLMSNGEQLEHFHLYEQPKDQKKDISSPAIRMHTDNGLLIGMTHGLHSANARESNEKLDLGSSLFIELPHGGVYQASCSENAVIFMVGQGGANWLNHVQLRAVPHALVLPWSQQGVSTGVDDADMPPQWRSWYGRMFLPPTDAAIPASSTGSSEVLSFGEMRLRQRDSVSGMDKTHSSLGCGYGKVEPMAGGNDHLSTTLPWLNKADSGSFRRLTTAASDNNSSDSDDGCGSSETLCWMQCMDNTDLTCGAGTSVACYDEGFNEVVPGDVMCPSGDNDNCQLQCVANSLLQPPINMDGFCYGTGTDMYMDGFTSYVNNDQTPQCLNLLFTEWTLDTSTKFAWACIMTVFLGVFTEMLGSLRRYLNIKLKSPVWKNFSRAGPLIMSTFYGVQVLLGYFLMLIAMTYQVELFVCVIMGLILGHATFNLNETPSSNTDPCCVGRVSLDNEGGSDGKGFHIKLNAEDSMTSPLCYQEGASYSVLAIDGMTCGSCVGTVKKALVSLKGVKSVDVKLGSPGVQFSGKAVIYHDDNNQSPVSVLISAVEGVGFDAKETNQYDI